MHVWAGEVDKLSTESWDLSTFEEARLQEWLDLFEGMELIGDN